MTNVQMTSTVSAQILPMLRKIQELHSPQFLTTIFSLKPREYAKEMVTGFIRLNGMTVGAVANRSKVYDAEGNAESYEQVLTVDGCKKAADFINFCDAFSIPVLSLTNVTGFEATLEAEKDMARAVAKLTYAFRKCICTKG